MAFLQLFWNTVGPWCLRAPICRFNQHWFENIWGKKFRKFQRVKLAFAAPANIYIAFALNLQLFPQDVHCIRDYMSRNYSKNAERMCAQVKCKYFAILYKGLGYLQIFWHSCWWVLFWKLTLPLLDTEEQRVFRKLSAIG